MTLIKPVRIMKRGPNYQIYFYNLSGERRRLTAGNCLQHAERTAAKYTDWLLDGKNPEDEIAKNIKAGRLANTTLRAFFPIFIERHGCRQSASMQTLYNHLFRRISQCPQLCDIPVASITKALMLDYMHARQKKDGVSAATVNREAALVKNMLFRALEWDYIDRNPLQGLRLFRESEKRRVELTPEQIRELVNLLPHPVSDIVRFAVLTGFRRENILSLRIESIRLHDITPSGNVDLVIKGGRCETFPLGTDAVQVLKRVIGERKTGFVFINPRTNDRYHSISKTFERAVSKLGLTVNNGRLRFHDMRHLHATWLLQSGVPLEAIRELLGHRERSTTDRYATLNRMEVGKYLNNLPSLEDNSGHKKSLDRANVGAG